MNTSKLSLDDKQALYDLIQEPGYKVFKRILDEFVAAEGEGLLNSPLSSQFDERALFFKKARFDGLKSFYRAWLDLAGQISKSQN